MEIASPSVPGGRGRGRSMCRARRLEAAGAMPIPVAAGATPIPVAAGATHIPVAVGVASPPLVPGGRGGPRNRRRSRRRQEAGGATSVSVAAELVTPISPVVNSVDGGACSHVSADLHRVVAESDLIHSSLRANRQHDYLDPRNCDTEYVTVDEAVYSDKSLLDEQVSSSISTKQEFFRIRSSQSLNKAAKCGEQSHNLLVPETSPPLNEQTVISTSTEEQDKLANLDNIGPSTGRKRKTVKVHDIPFEIFRVLVNPAKKQYAHRFGKPKNFAKFMEDVNSFPYVNFKKERKGNTYAFNIMAFVWHTNVLRLKTITADKTDKSGDGLIAFVEPVMGTVDSLCAPKKCMDYYGHVPSDIFRVTVREIVKGLCFLWMNGYYHGNLKWNTTYYAGNNSVKLGNFESKESLSAEEGRILDRNCLVSMLQQVADEAPLHHPSCSCSLLHLLIGMLHSIDLTSPIGLETLILDNSFFWTSGQRTDFFADIIPIKMEEEQFLNNLSTDLCILPWTTSYNREFAELVSTMNDYREKKGWFRYNEESVKDFVNCISGAYAHRKMMLEIEVDRTVARKHPLLIEKLRRLL